MLLGRPWIPLEIRPWNTAEPDQDAYKKFKVGPVPRSGLKHGSLYHHSRGNITLDVIHVVLPKY
jgi:hypothetical protein